MANVTTCSKCGTCYEASSEETANEPNRLCSSCQRGAVTIFMCGPSKCEHDYSGWEPIMVDGQERGGTAVCTKCGRTAFEEDAWL